MKKLAILTLTVLFLGTSLRGEWQLITNFEDANEEGNPTVNSNVVGTKLHDPDAEIQAFAGAEADPSPWVGDEDNMALHLDHMNYATGGQETAYLLLPGFADNPEDGGIKDGTTATLYFRWWMSRNGLHGTAVMLTDTLSDPPFNTGDNPNDTIMAGYGDHKTWWRIGHEAGHPAVDFGYSIFNMEAASYWPVDLLGEREEGKQLLAGVIPENQQYQPGVWMEMWIVYDTENDTKKEYQRQNDGMQIQNKWAIVDDNGNIEETIDYQTNFQGPTDLDYNGIYLANWCRPNQGNDTQVYMDDVWIDYAGENLATPPHGKTRSMVELDITARTVRATSGAQSIFLSMAPPPEAQVGKLVQLEDGTIVGQIASISGRELTLVEPLSVVVPGDQVLSFVEGEGEWTKVTDFEDPDGMFAEFNGLDNNVVGGKIWNVDAEVPGFVGAEADPSPWAGDEGNMALHVEHPNTAGGMSTAFVLLPEDIADGSVATLYFRWWMNKNGGHEAGIFMASREEFLKFRPPYNVGETPADRNNTIRHGYGDHQTWWRIAGEFSISDFGYSSPGEVQRNAPPVNTDEYLGPEDSGKQFLGAIPEQQQYQPGVWMEMWVIYDTDNDIRMEYQRQNDGVQRQNHWAIIDADSNVEKVIDHMPNSKGITDADYPGFYLVNWVRPNPNYDTQVYMDDVWIDYTGINLSTPPHGKSRSAVEIDTTPRAAAVSAGSGTITMTMAPPPEAEVGAGVYLADGTGLGTIASISGNTLTLGAPLPASVTVPSNSALTFGDPVDTTAGKFNNISTRAMVGTGDDVMIGGFIIGEGLQQVLVEAIGPELADRGVAGALADPVLTVTAADGTVLMVNDNWEDSQGQMVSDLWAGSPNVSAGSASSAAVLTLEPGNYTAKVEGKDGTTGVALVEVYQID